MLTGSPPYPQGTTVDKLVQHSTGRPPDPAELNHRVSPRLSLVVQRMMASNPDERYPSPQALIDDLSLIAEGLGLRATAPEGTIWRKPLYRSGSPVWEENRGWILAFAAILLVAIVGDRVYQAARNLRGAWSSSPDTLLVDRTSPATPADTSVAVVGGDTTTTLPDRNDAGPDQGSSSDPQRLATPEPRSIPGAPELSATGDAAGGSPPTGFSSSAQLPEQESQAFTASETRPLVGKVTASSISRGAGAAGLQQLQVSTGATSVTSALPPGVHHAAR